MFEGMNELVLNQATMKTALQTFLNDHVIAGRARVSVTGVSWSPTSNAFTVSFISGEVEPEYAAA